MSVIPILHAQPKRFLNSMLSKLEMVHGVEKCEDDVFPVT